MGVLRQIYVCALRCTNPKYIFYTLYIYSLVATLTIGYIDYMRFRQTDKLDVEEVLAGWESSNIVRSDDSNYIQMRYKPPPAARTGERGKSFHINKHFLEPLVRVGQAHYLLDQSSMRDFVFVTGSEDEMFQISKDAVASVQHYFPEKKVIYFDLGLTASQARQIKMWCNVIYRRFDYDKFPEHIRDTKRRAWKPLVIMEALGDYGAVFWLDPKVRLNSSDVNPIYRLALENGGIVAPKYNTYSNYAVTHRDVYKYFPTREHRQKHIEQTNSGALLIYNTEHVYRSILWWWGLCALEEGCISPVNTLACDFHAADKWREYGGCHRYDQAAINVLLSNLYGYDMRRYVPDRLIVQVDRQPSHRFQLLHC